MRILTFVLCLLCFSVSAQNNSINVYPWNPDSDNDNQIGVDDLQSFLTVYGNEFGLPPEPCTYDGTEFEDWVVGVLNQEIILDSIFFDFTILDTTTYYVVGCPDPITEDAEFHNYGMLYYEAPGSDGLFECVGEGAYGHYARFYMFFLSEYGEYRMRLQINSVPSLFDDGLFWVYNQGLFENPTMYLPFPENFGFDIDGHILAPWMIPGNDSFSVGVFLHGNELTLIPYWHYADE
jgi:hypothetical protein